MVLLPKLYRVCLIEILIFMDVRLMKMVICLFVQDDESKYLLVMEYANGGTLRNYLNINSSTLTWPDKYELAYQLAYAVLCLHKEGIVHRDLVNFITT